MIRRASSADTDKIMPLWLETTIKAHSFIPAKYWQDNFAYVREELLPQTETFVFCDRHCVKGFISLSGSYIGALFVDEKAQGRGIGRKLIEYVSRSRPQLSLKVYSKNKSAIKFYHHCGFKILSENMDEMTGEKELLMVWARGCLSGHQKRLAGDS